MEQHPVPQHIASFEFKLFGNLTVRQFTTLAIPMSVAAAIFFSQLTPYLRIPLAGAFALLGLFAALVPIGGRPFDKWVVAFIKAVLSPTQRMWTKEPAMPQFLNIVIKTPQSEDHVPETITAQGRERLKNYLRSLPKGQFTPMDVKEQIAIQRLGLESLPYESQVSGGSLPPPILWPTSSTQPLFAQGSLPQINQTMPVTMAQTPPQEERYAAIGEPRPYGRENKLEESLPIVSQTHEKAAPIINAHAKPFALPGLQKKLAPQIQKALEIAPPVKAQLASEANSTVENVISLQTPGQKFRLIHGIGKTRARKLHFAPPEGFDLSKLPIRGERRFEISEELKKRFSVDTAALFQEKGQQPRQAVPMAAASVPIPKTESKIHPSSIPRATQYSPKPKISTKVRQGVSLKSQNDPQFDSQMTIGTDQSKNVPLPTNMAGLAKIVPLTNMPNVISGIVTDNQGAPMERVILIVKDKNGVPVRALKTNKLGQFLSATPLASGQYSLEIESQTHTFAPFSLNLEGKIVQPMELKPEGGQNTL